MENKEMDQDAKKGSCCGHGACGGGKKLIAGIFIGLILAAVSLGFFFAGKCIGSGGMCPFSQTAK